MLECFSAWNERIKQIRSSTLFVVPFFKKKRKKKKMINIGKTSSCLLVVCIIVYIAFIDSILYMPSPLKHLFIFFAFQNDF